MPGLERLEREIPSCRRCKRLVVFRESVARRKRAAFRFEKYWGKPVPGFGDRNARLLLIGLAPAAHGGNRTGRMFTGDGSAATLLKAMYAAGFANRPRSLAPGDGLRLKDAYITAVVKCAPPENRPLPGEIRNCAEFLAREMRCLRRVRAILALGRTAFESVLPLLRPSPRVPRAAFRHGAVYGFPGGRPALFVSYHPSRRNTQTGLLTPAMLNSVFLKIRAHVLSTGKPHRC